MFMRKAVLCASFALGVIAIPASAQVGIGFSIGVAPPPPRYEVVPAPREGYYWAPGYWRWEEPRRTHVWVEGSWVESRPGHRWRQDRWVQRERVYYYEPGGYEVIVR
jgi:hypothetical protein